MTTRGAGPVTITVETDASNENHKLYNVKDTCLENIEQKVRDRLKIGENMTFTLHFKDQDDKWIVLDTAAIEQDEALKCEKWTLKACFPEEPQRKRMRAESCLEGKLQSIQDLRQILEQLVSEVAARADASYCSPRQLDHTWGLSAWGKALAETYSIFTSRTGSRDARVAALITGSGYGKSHALLCAAEAWAGSVGGAVVAPHCHLYITYNLEQILFGDRNPSTVQAAFLLRVLLATQEHSNTTSDQALVAFFQKYTFIDIDSLVDEVVRSLQAWLSTKGSDVHFVLAVDECIKLKLENGSLECVRLVVSVLGRLTDKLRREGHKCLAIVSSLSSGPFATQSDRGVVRVTLPPPTPEDLIKFVAEALEQHIEQKKGKWAGAHLLAGAHWRSATFAVDLLAGRENLTVSDLSHSLAARLCSGMTPDQQADTRDYILLEYKTDKDRALARFPLAEMFIDQEGSVPPCVAWTLFAEPPEGCRTSPIHDFFSNSLSVSAYRQLELCGASFDRFKAQYQLPMLPKGIPIIFPDGNHNFPYHEWFYNLTLPVLASGIVDESSIIQGENFCMEGPQPGKIYHPSAQNHRHIDRALVAQHPEGQKCLVLYQDKVSHQLRQAMASLGAAAALAESWMKVTGIKSVLCVAQVLDCQTSHQVDRFAYPLIILSEHNGSLLRFYRGTFVGAVKYQRVRSIAK
eukprot:CAMPEP_0206551890 /NCGR_PEP_ID=MMETSP0325_2-20121206/15776_1 /ASSEMBLY_ACC=CAM_ASM_000347 /TAXON_ID=2866 /ORGANISM="Crypthecodinium cohnii, Strain Seligo" /LENGTH=689 /DNA_ID=CAMNT_0054051703 /DNA_START=84 /DNA_END=2153 /DNA_ORIENTATION=+